MTMVLTGAVGLALGGPGVGLALVLVVAIRSLVVRRPRPKPIRPVLMILIVELRAGRSILGALQEAARVFPDDTQLVLASRVASVSGLTAAVDESRGSIRGCLPSWPGPSVPARPWLTRSGPSSMRTSPMSVPAASRGRDLCRYG